MKTLKELRKHSENIGPLPKHLRDLLVPVSLPPGRPCRDPKCGLVDYLHWHHDPKKVARPCRREQKRASENHIREIRRRARRCPKCGGKPERGKRHCRPCLDVAAALMRKIRKAGKAK